MGERVQAQGSSLFLLCGGIGYEDFYVTASSCPSIFVRVQFERTVCVIIYDIKKNPKKLYIIFILIFLFFVLFYFE